MQTQVREEMMRELEAATTPTAMTLTVAGAAAGAEAVPTTAGGDDHNMSSLHFLRTAAVQSHQEDLSHVTSQLNSEWAARLRQEVDAAWQQSALVYEAKLAKLEQLARENERVLAQQVEERMNRRLDHESVKFLSVQQRLEMIAAEDVVRAKQAGMATTLSHPIITLTLSHPILSHLKTFLSKS